MKALIGSTGFVGQNLIKFNKFDHLYNSKNIEEIINFSYDYVYCAAPSAVKWKANKDPQEDLNNISSLIKIISKINTKHFILFSTIDVYDRFPSTELDHPNIYNSCFYGKNRILLENFVSFYFKKFSIIRMPALFGSFLKKNLLFDLLNNNIYYEINANDEYQWFYLNDLNEIINYCLTNNINYYNISTEPISNKFLIHNFFKNYTNKLIYRDKNISYDMRSIYNKYYFSKEQILEKIYEFINFKHCL